MNFSVRLIAMLHRVRRGLVLAGLLCLLLWCVGPAFAQIGLPVDEEPSDADADTSPTATLVVATTESLSPIPVPTFTPTPTAAPTPQPVDAGLGDAVPFDAAGSDGLVLGLGLGSIVLLVLAGLVVLGLAFWARTVLIGFERKKRYQEDALLDEQPSVDERLLSELTTMHVMLLRGSVIAYYEKVFALMRRLLKSRGLLDGMDADSSVIQQRLRTAGVDAAFVDCVESISSRCDAVILRGEEPDAAAHEKIAKDLKMLIQMRPHAVHGRRERAPQEPSDQ